MDPEIIKQLQQQNEQIIYLQQQLAVQEIKINKVKATKFDLTPDQIIRNFNEISSFSGEDNYKLKSFLKSVEDVENLCGQNNEELKQYCLRKLINNKIIGNARNTIMEIPDQHRNWINVVQQLKLRFRPKSSIHQLLYSAKELKVFNFKDLFNKLNNIKSRCSEICDFDDEGIFTYNSIDRELVQVLKSKLVPIMQTQVDINKSLFELDNIFCQSEIYTTEDIIKNEYKINRNKDLNFRENKFSSHNKKFNNFNYYNNNYNNKITQEKLNQKFTDNQGYRNNHRLYDSNSNNNNYRNPNNQTGQFKRQIYNQNEHFNNNNRSRQYRQNIDNNRSNQYNRYNYNNQRKVEPMEIDNIVQHQEINNEVNFIEPPQQANYP